MTGENHNRPSRLRLGKNIRPFEVIWYNASGKQEISRWECELNNLTQAGKGDSLTAQGIKKAIQIAEQQSPHSPLRTTAEAIQLYRSQR